MKGKRTIRFTCRVDGARGKFAGIVMASTVPGYLASLSDDEELNDGGFLSVRLIDGPLLVAKAVNNEEKPVPYFKGIPYFAKRQGVLAHLDDAERRRQLPEEGGARERPCRADRQGRIHGAARKAGTHST